MIQPKLPHLITGTLGMLCLAITALGQDNLVINPGFEDGPYSDAPPWGVGGWRGTVRATATDAHSGRRSLLMEGGGDEGGINSAVQIIPVDPTGTTTYHFRTWVKIPSATSEGPKNARTRWMFSEGTGGGQVTPIDSDQWTQIDDGGQNLTPPAGAQHIVYRMYGLTGRYAMYLDDCELVGEPNGNPSYPGITGVVKDADGKPVAGALVFLNSRQRAQEFANSSAVTDSEGKYTVCVADDGSYYAVAYKAGYDLSSEKQVDLTTGALVTLNPVIKKGQGGRNLAIKTGARSTAVDVSAEGRLNDPQFSPEYVFDGNSLTTRYYNNANADPAKDRWIYVDLDPVGKQAYPIREFVLTWLGITQNVIGWPGLGDVAAKDFALEYTSGDPSTESNWSSKVAFSVTDAPVSFAPVVVRLDTPITARAVRFHVTNPAGGGFGPTEIEVNAATLPRGTVSGVVKDSAGKPVAGAQVVVWNPTRILSDPDIYGAGNPVPYVIIEEATKAAPYDMPVSKTIEQTYTTDSQGRYTFDVHPGRPIRVSALADGHAYNVAAITPPEDGSPVVRDLAVPKTVVLSGTVRGASGPLYNAVVQIGGPGSREVAVTGADGSYSFAAAMGDHELYADAVGYAGQTVNVTLAADGTRDITLVASNEPGSLADNFDAAISGWEIARYDTNWVAVGTSAAAVRDTTQNATPGGKGSAVIEDQVILGSNGTTELPVAFQVLQRSPAQRIAVTPGKSYNVYFKVKAENFVSPEHRDAVHYQVVWRDAAGKVVGTILSHPHWLYPQPFWYLCDRGHPEGTPDSVTLARLVPPAGAATLDVRVGWVRVESAIDPNTQIPANPAGSLLYVDDLVVDAYGSAVVEPTISVAKNGASVVVTYTGTLESAAQVTGPWTAVAGATSPLTVNPTEPSRFYRSK